MEAIGKHARITGEEREQLTKQLVAGYAAGASVRELSEQVGRSYGFVHRLLKEAGVTMRSRGDWRKPA